jgi:hypothetical protein
MRRPTAVTVFGILHIVFAGLGVIGLLANVFLLFAKPDLLKQNPAVKLMEDNPAYANWVKLSIPIGLVNCCILLAAGIGLLALKEWARKLSIFYGIYALILAVVNMTFAYVFLLRPMMEQAARQNGPEAAGAIGGVFEAGIGGCFALVYPILVLAFMTRPGIKAAFRPAADGWEAEPPSQW